MENSITNQLVRAAKAVGLGKQIGIATAQGVELFDVHGSRYWNPLTNADDLWQLISKLRLVVDFETGRVISEHGMIAFNPTDEYAARLCIVSAASSFA